jgi:serine/threonine protein kinase
MLSSYGTPIYKYYPSGYTIIVQEYYEAGDLLSYISNTENAELSTSQVLNLFQPLLKFLSTLHEDHQLAMLNLSASKVLIARVSQEKVPTDLHFYDASKCRTSRVTSEI